VAPSQDTPLEVARELTGEQIASLKGAWVDTIEQFLGIAATREGRDSLATMLRVPEAEVRRLAAALRSHVSPEVAARLDEPPDTTDQGLGALPPR
jgi:hypothetical protein